MILAFPETHQMTLKTMEGTKHSLSGSRHNSLPSRYEMGAKPLIVWFQTGMYFYGHSMGHKHLVSSSTHTCMQCLICWLHATDSQPVRNNLLSGSRQACNVRAIDRP